MLRYIKIGFLLFIWAVLGTCLLTFIFTRLQYIDEGAYLIIPTIWVEKPITYLFYDVNHEDMYSLAWFSYGFINLVAISLIVFAGYCAYKYFKKHK